MLALLEVTGPRGWWLVILGVIGAAVGTTALLCLALRMFRGAVLFAGVSLGVGAMTGCVTLVMATRVGNTVPHGCSAADKTDILAFYETSARAFASLGAFGTLLTLCVGLAVLRLAFGLRPTNG